MITPMEIQNHEFNVGWKGYEQEAVRHFLYALAEDFETLIEQNHELDREVAILRERVKDMEGRDKILKDTLITAQQVKVDLRENAEKEAELIVKEAEMKAEKVIDAAKENLTKVKRQMVEMRRIRDDLLAEAEMMVSRFTHFTEAERQMATESDKLHNFVARKKAAPKKVVKKA